MIEQALMSRGRFAGVCAVAFVASQILEIVIHGFILASDYRPFYGTLLRPMSPQPWQGVLLPIAHLSFIIALVWVYDRLSMDRSRVSQGIRLGVIGFFIGQLPLWVIWYAEQPWPGSLLVKQLVLEFVASVIVGLVITLTAPPPRASAA